MVDGMTKCHVVLFCCVTGENIDDDDDFTTTEVDGGSNPLVDLNSRFEEERDALMRMLSGQDDMWGGI